MKQGSRRGFTLIEMLIVIAIIGILASVVLVGLGPVQRRGRDARRIADLKQVQNALELYFSKCGYYPGAAQPNSPCEDRAGTTPSDWDALETAIKDSSLGIRQLPDDPSSGKHYEYGGDGVTYVISATLEDDSNPALNNKIDEPLFGIDCGGERVYCVEF